MGAVDLLRLEYSGAIGIHRRSAIKPPDASECAHLIIRSDKLRRQSRSRRCDTAMNMRRPHPDLGYKPLSDGTTLSGVLGT
jgi:hypothetical protein